MRKIILSALVATCLFSSFTTVVDASWLSKAWGRLENSLDTVSTDAPPSVDRKNYNVGHLLPKEDMKIAGVPLGSTFPEIKASLGNPQYETNDTLQYGGIKYHRDIYLYRDYRVDRIVVTNRDATTARGIAVGDTLKQVVAVYGQPDFIYKDYYFYGYQQAGSDYIDGIYFTHDGKRVTRISITNS